MMNKWKLIWLWSFVVGTGVGMGIFLLSSTFQRLVMIGYGVALILILVHAKECDEEKARQDAIDECIATAIELQKELRKQGGINIHVLLDDLRRLKRRRKTY
ncbi:MAG: hypothetical protein ACTSPB_21140 [Candidatus Thorarchaeota archaeon]